MEREEHCSPDVVLLASELIRKIQLGLVITGEVDSCNISDFIEILPKENVLKRNDTRKLEVHEIIIVPDKCIETQETNYGRERVLQEKLVLAEKKFCEVLAMYKCKLKETSDMEERNRFLESELKMCQDKLRSYEVELKFNKQCFGQPIQMSSQCPKLGSGRIKQMLIYIKTEIGGLQFIALKFKSKYT